MGKVVLITGTSSGLGKVAAIDIAAQGYTVIAAMRETTGKNAAAAKELSAIQNITVVEMDISSEASVQAAVEKVIEAAGRIDVVVNNAAVWGAGTTEAYSIEQHKKMFDVNYFGAVRVYNAVLPFMRKADAGLFINISSGASGFTNPFMIPYFASKMALEALTEGLQDELKLFNIDSVSIQPGVFDTGMELKTGVRPDRPDVVASYGEKATVPMEKMAKALMGHLDKYDMDPKLISKAIIDIIAMESGKRPLRYPVDPLAEGTDQEFVEMRDKIKRKWASKYGFEF